MCIFLILVDIMYLVVLFGLIEIVGKKGIVIFYLDNLYNFIIFV